MLAASRRLATASTMLLAAVCVCALLALPTVALAKNVYVSSAGSDLANGLSTSTALASVAEAVSVAATGDVIEVGSGTFPCSAWLNAKNLTFEGAGSTNTTLTGGGAGPVLAFFATRGTVRNLTITGGRSTDFGGGVRCDMNATVTVEACRIVGNSAGGGQLSPVGGGGIGGRASSVTVTNCLIAHNTIGDSRDMFNSPLTGSGAGILSAIAPMVVTNCTIVSNTSTGSAGGGIAGAGAAVTVTNCILRNNAFNDLSGYSATYSAVGISTIALGSTCTTADPLFVDAARGDYRLAAASPCRDTGTAVGAPATDLLGVARPQGSGIDMGAYEYAVAGPTYKVKYAVYGGGGTISGDTSQAVASGGSAIAVLAVPDEGYYFVGWSDGTVNPARTDANITADKTYWAFFATTTVTPRLVAPKSVKKGKSLKLEGAVTAAAQGTVRVYLWRLVGKKYKSMGTLSATLSAGVFSKSFKPKYKGMWRFRFYYPGVAPFKAGWSGYQYTKVK